MSVFTSIRPLTHPFISVCIHPYRPIYVSCRPILPFFFPPVHTSAYPSVCPSTQNQLNSLYTIRSYNPSIRSTVHPYYKCLFERTFSSQIPYVRMLPKTFVHFRFPSTIQSTLSRSCLSPSMQTVDHNPWPGRSLSLWTAKTPLGVLCAAACSQSVTTYC